MSAYDFPKFKTAAELSEKIEAFFSRCDEPPTVSSLAFFLGFNSRSDLRNYQGKPSYMKLIGRALLRIEEYTERKLFDKNCHSGAKLCLFNNFKDWSDRPESAAFESDDKIAKILKMAQSNQ